VNQGGDPLVPVLASPAWSPDPRVRITSERDLRTCRCSAWCDTTDDEERVVVSLLRPHPVRGLAKLFDSSRHHEPSSSETSSVLVRP